MQLFGTSWPPFWKLIYNQKVCRWALISISVLFFGLWRAKQPTMRQQQVFSRFPVCSVTCEQSFLRQLTLKALSQTVESPSISSTSHALLFSLCTDKMWDGANLKMKSISWGKFLLHAWRLQMKQCKFEYFVYRFCRTHIVVLKLNHFVMSQRVQTPHPWFFHALSDWFDSENSLLCASR